jgi:hypothetical protein
LKKESNWNKAESRGEELKLTCDRNPTTEGILYEWQELNKLLPGHVVESLPPLIQQLKQAKQHTTGGKDNNESISHGPLTHNQRPMKQYMSTWKVIKLPIILW